MKTKVEKSIFCSLITLFLLIFISPSLLSACLFGQFNTHWTLSDLQEHKSTENIPSDLLCIEKIIKSQRSFSHLIRLLTLWGALKCTYQKEPLIPRISQTSRCCSILSSPLIRGELKGLQSCYQHLDEDKLEARVIFCIKGASGSFSSSLPLAINLLSMSIFQLANVAFQFVAVAKVH